MLKLLVCRFVSLCGVCLEGVDADEVDIPAYSDIPGQSTAYHPFQITQTLPLPDELHTEMRRADVDRESGHAN